MKFIHTGDWHFGSSRSLPNYLDRQVSGVKAIFSLAKRLGIDTICACGDLVEKDLRPHERDALLDLILRADDSGIRLLIVSGNHDILARGYSNLRFLQTLFERKRFKNTYVAAETPLIVEITDQPFLLMPGFWEGDLNADIAIWADKCAKPPVVLMHEVVAGAKADNGFPLQHGVRLNPKLPVLYFACGDLHMRQRLPGLKNGFYAGSPIQHDFGEALPKGVLVVDTEAPMKPEFVELAQKFPLVTVSTAAEVEATTPTAWVRVKADHLIDGQSLSAQVVKVEYAGGKTSVSEKTGDQKVSTDPLEGLKAYLRDKVGLRKRSLRLALERAEAHRLRVSP